MQFSRGSHVSNLLGAFIFACALIFFVGVLPTAAATGTITKFKVPTPSSFPNGITTGPDGALWFVEPNTGKIGRLTTTGAFTQFILPGNVNQDEVIESAKSITTGGALTQFTSPQGAPQAITTGPDGALWFTANFFPAAKVGRVTTAGVFTFFTVASSADGVTAGASIATGLDGKLWTTDYDSTLSRGSILSITTTGTVKSFPFPTLNEIDGITSGPDAKMWFTSSDLSTNVGSVGNITTS